MLRTADANCLIIIRLLFCSTGEHKCPRHEGSFAAENISRWIGPTPHSHTCQRFQLCDGETLRRFPAPKTYRFAEFGEVPCENSYRGAGNTATNCMGDLWVEMIFRFILYQKLLYGDRCGCAELRIYQAWIDMEDRQCGFSGGGLCGFWSGARCRCVGWAEQGLISGRLEPICRAAGIIHCINCVDWIIWAVPYR